EILTFLHQSFLNAPADIDHIFAIPEVIQALQQSTQDWHKSVSIMTEHGIAVATIGSALSYFESMTEVSLSANYLQGLRDYFGAHTYERTDRAGVFHTHWN
ncbi:MAG: hypothetical protein PHU93_03865, partial [Candidatus Gracilibacteria bacterium]|nr:hypothetical protein [Candidatus Gracilibacteria bacterium]